MLTDSDQVQDRSKEYIEDFFDKNNKKQEEDRLSDLDTDTEENVKRPPILFSSTHWVKNGMKYNVSGEWPDDFLDSVIIVIENNKLSWRLQTHAMRLQVSQGHQREYHLICYVRFPISVLW